MSLSICAFSDSVVELTRHTHTAKENELEPEGAKVQNKPSLCCVVFGVPFKVSLKAQTECPTYLPNLPPHSHTEAHHWQGKMLSNLFTVGVHSCGYCRYVHSTRCKH